MRGGHLTSDDFFESFEVEEWKKRVKDLQNKKDIFLAKKKLEEEAKATLALVIPFLANQQACKVPMLN